MASNAFKIVLLGEGRVGKTCLCLRFVRNAFSNDQESTLEATYLEKRINFGNNSIQLHIWDTAGQERYHALSPLYYREANGALLVYDVTDRDSFTKVRTWVRELRKIMGKNIVLVIAGNKADLEKYRQVDQEEAEAYAESVGAVHIQCSAKTGTNVEQAFLEITKRILKSKKEAAQPAALPPPSSTPLTNTNNPRGKIDFQEAPQEGGSGCC